MKGGREACDETLCALSVHFFAELRAWARGPRGGPQRDLRTSDLAVAASVPRLEPLPLCPPPCTRLLSKCHLPHVTAIYFICIADR
jgi:hypothetical protein